MKRILGNLRKTIQENNLINDKDRVAVGVSGGKDSMLLLYSLKKLQNFIPIDFELEAFFVDLGFSDFPINIIEDFCTSLDVPLNIVKTTISEVIFDIRKESSPCSLCANMRKGALHDAVIKKGFNKLALGHHQDDAVETLFMNMIYTGRINTFMMDTYLSRADIHVIRPFITTAEKDIIHSTKANDIPIAKNPCPMDKNTKREEIKFLLNDFYHNFPESRKNFVTAINNPNHVQLIK
ncbi:MAG: tRNA 2-thiocytidine biosynthesis protein TtcA [Clostridiales bacterium]|nr:tRNA 2-thiocytidine biosynthesis protein TtcA [Clostridiales bacterium]